MRRKKATQATESSAGGYRQYVLLIVAAAGIGFLAQFQWIGSIAIGAYGVYALWRTVPSRLTFTMALMALSLVPIAILFGRWIIAQNFGAYSFLLFAVGLVCLTFELRRATQERRNMHNVERESV